MRTDAQTLLPFDPPAAHSMDWDWFAVDEAGEVAVFHPNEVGDSNGPNPLLDPNEASIEYSKDKHLDFFYAKTPTLEIEAYVPGLNLDYDNLPPFLAEVSASSGIQMFIDDLLALPEDPLTEWFDDGEENDEEDREEAWIGMMLFPPGTPIPPEFGKFTEARLDTPHGVVLWPDGMPNVYDLAVRFRSEGLRFRVWNEHGEWASFRNPWRFGFHEYIQVSYTPDSPYIWRVAPRHAAITLDQLPERFRRPGRFVRVRDRLFRDREPIQPPLDIGPCVWWHSWMDGFAGPEFENLFPIAGANWTSEQQAEVFEFGGESLIAFAASDAERRLALFQISRTGPLPSGATRLSIGEIRQALGARAAALGKEQPGASRHWLEWPFGPAPPRRMGFYHYHQSGLRAGPCVRIAEPPEPIAVDALSPQEIESLRPLPLPGVSFARDDRFQPLESMPCKTEADLWLPADLSSVRVVPGKSLAVPLDEARVRRVIAQARAHYTYLASLTRTGAETP